MNKIIVEENVMSPAEIFMKLMQDALNNEANSQGNHGENKPSLRNFELLPNCFLKSEVKVYYSLDYYYRKHPLNPNFILTLKNTYNYNGYNYLRELDEACETLANIVSDAIKEIAQYEDFNTICVVPRSKARHTYIKDQLRFLYTIKGIIGELKNDGYFHFEDGSDYIIRHTNTLTTHLAKSGYGGDGKAPYPGITTNTCNISSNIRGKRVLLIDDIYTKNTNVDEDCIQALFDNGAESVVLYTIGRTVKK